MIQPSSVSHTFRFSALTPDGQTIRGTVSATSEAEAVAWIRRQGNLPLRAEPGGLGIIQFLLGWLPSGNFRFAGRRHGLRRTEVTHLTRELSVMLAAGQDLDRAMRFLVETASGPRTRTVLERIRVALRDGRSLHVALASCPDSFPPLYVGLVRAAEAGGSLSATLEHLAGMMERERALVATIQSAMIYPALLSVAAVGSVVLLLTQVLPQFVPLFMENGATLPPSTRLLIGAGHWLAQYGVIALSGLFLIGMGGRWILRQPGPRLRADRLWLHLPVIGVLLRETIAARFTRTLGTLLTNGVPLLTALGIVRDVIGNRAVLGAVEQATDTARGGGVLSRSLGASGLFPSRTIHLLRLGEDTAQLGPLALRAAGIHEEQVRLRVQRLVALLVPLITIVMGAMIAGIVSSLMLAMLGLNDLAQH
ncbi:type II secretion system protein [Komagataeibacter diospyri]|uniref:type II secretion system F family protein n=1 Tax=Komagataeibacter diospyri TaxID=1932662 RepID=UPI001134C28C|nr:type II secretion system F family protein [Komagataeibacter diospyri]GCE91852.1 type II secretion system protein [Komagataeibacter diospyri]